MSLEREWRQVLQRQICDSKPKLQFSYELLEVYSFGVYRAVIRRKSQPSCSKDYKETWLYTCLFGKLDG